MLGTFIVIIIGLCVTLPIYISIPLSSLMIAFYWLPRNVISIFERIYPTILMRNPKNSNIALTFDDSPTGSHKYIIDLLDGHNMKATFFIISGNITNEDKQIFINAVKNGHQLANHGKTNSVHILKKSEELINEINHCANVINEIYREANIDLPKQLLYRPGNGFCNQKMIDLVTNNNHKLTLGTVYPFDDKVKNDVINYYHLVSHITNGDIVIMHDRAWTIPLLKKLLVWMEMKKYVSVTVENLFK